MFLLDDLLLLPFKGFVGIASKIHEMVDRELHDPEHLQDELLTLQLLYEMDEIDDEEYRRAAAELEERLSALSQMEDTVTG